MLRSLAFSLLLVATPALAEEGEGSAFRFGGDVYATGGSILLEEAGVDDAFAAGERVELAAPITGDAYLAGRRVIAGAEIGGGLDAAAADLTVSGPVAGNALLLGYDVSIEQPVGGDLRAATRTLRVGAPVGGSLLASGGTVSLDAPVAGDAAIDAAVLDLGPAARIGGRLTLYGPAADAAVPEAVVPPDRVERLPAAEPPPPSGPLPFVAPGWAALLVGFVIGVLILAALAFLAALVAPRGVERLGARIADRPLRTLWIGVLTLSVLIGGVVLAALTVVGLLAVPVILVALVLACFVGYLVAVYLVGRMVWTGAGGFPPDTVLERAGVALTGALVVSVLGLVPFVGWPLLLALTLAGVGAIAVAWFGPEFRT